MKWELLQSSEDDGGLTIFDGDDIVCEHIAEPEIGVMFMAAPAMLAALKRCVDQLALKRPKRGKLDFDLELAIAEAGRAMFAAGGNANG